jgi:hypothetical protein
LVPGGGGTLAGKMDGFPWCPKTIVVILAFARDQKYYGKIAGTSDKSSRQFDINVDFELPE